MSSAPSVTSGRTRTAVVVGAGIGGLCAAVALARGGTEPLVFERSRDLAPLGAGLTLWPNALHALRRIEAGAVLETQSAALGAGGIRTSRGKTLVSTADLELERRFGAPAIVLHRSELQRALLDALAPFRPTLGASLNRFEQDETGVTARFDDGREVRGDVLVGADGVDSTVRRVLLADGGPRYAGYIAWRAVTRFDAGRVIAAESWGPGSVFGLLPLSDGRLYWFGTRPARSGERDEGPEQRRQEVLERFAAWHEPISEVVESTAAADVLRHDVVDRPPRRGWSQGRATLLGDAAHPMTPHLGQGACQAIEDAVVLARCLGAAEDVAQALRAYESRRFERTARIVERSRRIGRLAQWRSPLAIRARDALVERLPARVQLDQLAEVVGFRA